MSDRNTAQPPRPTGAQKEIRTKADLSAAIKLHISAFKRQYTRAGKRARIKTEDIAGLAGISRSAMYYFLAGKTLLDEFDFSGLLQVLRISAEDYERLTTARDYLAAYGEDLGVLPRLLPKGITGFVGRGREVRELLSLLDPSVPGAPAPAVTVISGPPGVGKTTLAMQVAREICDRFPDGQLHIDLRGYCPDRPRDSADVLEIFLDALGVQSEQLPQRSEARMGLYRSRLEGKRVLVVLDNAASVEQVRPLLPGSPGCAVVVTSRSDLSGLVAADGAQLLPLDPLSPAEAIELLQGTIGSRAEEERDAASDIARQCACLPLALRIVAQRARVRPQLTLASLARQLVDERNRLDQLSTPDDEPTTNLRAVFSWSYKALSSEHARLFRILSLHPGPDFGTRSAAAIAATPMEASTTQKLLEQLAELHMIERTGTDRYRFHDLLRDYASELTETTDDAPARAMAIRRVLDWYLHTAHASYIVMMPRIYPIAPDDPDWPCPTLTFQSDSGEALDWCKTEHRNLLAAVHQANHQKQHKIAWQLVAALSGFFLSRKPWNDWITCAEIGLASAQETHHLHGQTWMLTHLGLAKCGIGEYDQAQDSLQHSLEICQQINDRQGEGVVLSVLGDVERERGRLDKALDYYLHAESIFSSLGADASWGVGLCLHSLGLVYEQSEQLPEGIKFLERALEQSHRLGDSPWGKAQTLHHLGNLYRKAGRLEDAIASYCEAINLRRSIKDQCGEAADLHQRGIAHFDNNQPEQAAQALRQALVILEALGDQELQKAEVLHYLKALDQR